MNNKIKQIITYSVQGKPLTQKEMQKAIDEDEGEYSKGNYTIQEQLKIEIKTWKI